MQKNFSIRQGIYLVQPPHELDLHNCFDFCGFEYCLIRRRVLLRWQRAVGSWVAVNTPASLTLTFEEVDEFRCYPRNADKPFTEDSCLSTFGYWTDEPWAEGVIVVEPDQAVEAHWLVGLEFMSGATLAIQGGSACADIKTVP